MNPNRRFESNTRRAVARGLGATIAAVLLALVLGTGLGGNAAHAQGGPRFSPEERAQMKAERRMLREERQVQREAPGARPLSHEERQQLRRDIRNHGRDVYGGPRRP